MDEWDENYEDEDEDDVEFSSDEGAGIEAGSGSDAGSDGDDVEVSQEEQDAFLEWGAWIQRADALADLDKDANDGLISSLPSLMMFQRDPGRWSEAHSQPGQGATSSYAMIANMDIDVDLMPPDSAHLDQLSEKLSTLGGVPSLLRWIHGFLTWRYLQHPDSRRDPDHPRFAPFLHAREDWRAYLGGIDLNEAPAPGEGSCLGL